MSTDDTITYNQLHRVFLEGAKSSLDEMEAYCGELIAALKLTGETLAVVMMLQHMFAQAARETQTAIDELRDEPRDETRQTPRKFVGYRAGGPNG